MDESIKPVDEHTIKAGDVFTHKDNEKTYVVVSVGKMKQEDGDWVPCVTYSRAEDSPTYFTRDEAKFRERFTRGAKE